jgi:two-component system cell cycle sensor histidine kinase/response regulator CckA
MLEFSLALESQQRFAAILEAAPDAVVVADRDGRIVLLNEQTRVLFGYQRDELLGKKVELLLPARHRRRHVGHRAAYADDPQTRPMGAGLELAARRKDGTEFPVDISLATVDSEDGPLVLAFVREIGEQRIMDRVARELAAIVESSDHAIIGKSLDGTITSWNAGAARIYGYSAEEAVGRDVSMLSLPERQDEIRELLERLSRGQRVEHLETVRLRKDGTTIDVSLTTSPIRDGAGAIVGASTIARDISQRTRAAEIQAKADQRIASILEAAPDAVVVADRDGRIVLLNEQTRVLFGYQRDELLGKKVDVLLPTRLRRRHVGHRAAYADDPRTRPMGAGLELAGRRKDGTEFPVEINLGTVDSEDGPLVLAFVRDTSEPRRLQDERREFERNLLETQRLESLGLLAGGVAHDFNNLLAVMLGNASLALTMLDHEAPAHRELEQIALAAQRAGELTTQMLAYAGKGRYVVRPVRISGVVREMIDLIESTVSKKALLELDLADCTPTIEADVNQLRQVVLNLITNASEALADRTGTITVCTGTVEVDRTYLAQYELAEEIPGGTYAFLEVADTGAGMDAETRAKIFDPFFTTKFTGRGLGLAAVLGIVRAHGGAIKVCSEAGAGTSFRLLFPASDRSEVTPSGRLEADDWRGSGTVLVADDEKPVREMAASMLERLGYAVVLAGDGIEALRILAESSMPLAFVLLDLMMPRMDGEEVLDELERQGATTPIILCSGYNSQELSQRLVGRGVASFLQKPYSFADLRNAVRNAVATSPAT